MRQAYFRPSRKTSGVRFDDANANVYLSPRSNKNVEVLLKFSDTFKKAKNLVNSQLFLIVDISQHIQLCKFIKSFFNFILQKIR